MTKLRKIFSHSFKGKIWQIRPVAGADELVIEVRDEDEGNICFYVRDSENELREVIPENMAWWSTLLTARKDVFLTRSFGEEGDPEHSELIAYDSRNGKRLWDLQNAMPEAEGMDQIQVTAEGVKRQIHLVSGQPATEHAELEYPENKNLVYPFSYRSGTAYFETVAEFLKQVSGDQSVEVIEYLEYAGRILISYYIKKDNGLTNKIYVLDKQGNMVLSEILGDQLKGISDNTFFIYQGNLIFANSSNHFFEYSLS